MYTHRCVYCLFKYVCVSVHIYGYSTQVVSSSSLLLMPFLSLSLLRSSLPLCRIRFTTIILTCSSLAAVIVKSAHLPVAAIHVLGF